MSTVSWIILTHNRSSIVKKALTHCMGNAGATWDELIWVDNGSNTVNYVDIAVSLRSKARVDIALSFYKNSGVAKGYNRGLGLATKDYIVITGCDMLMPTNWLRTFKECVAAAPNIGVLSMYSKPLSLVPERLRSLNTTYVAGHALIPALPIERRIFKRELLADIGYFPETFGLYGYDDIAWAMRAESVAQEKGLVNYVLADQIAQHLGTEGIDAHTDDGDDPAYHAFKRHEVADPAKKAEFERLRALGWPKFSPFL